MFSRLCDTHLKLAAYFKRRSAYVSKQAYKKANLKVQFRKKFGIK